MRKVQRISNEPVLHRQPVPEFGGREGGVANFTPKFGLKRPDCPLQAALIQAVGGNEKVRLPCGIAYKGAGEYDRRKAARTLQGKDDTCVRYGRDFMNEFQSARPYLKSTLKCHACSFCLPATVRLGLLASVMVNLPFLMIPRSSSALTSLATAFDGAPERFATAESVKNSVGLNTKARSTLVRAAFPALLIGSLLPYGSSLWSYDGIRQLWEILLPCPQKQRPYAGCFRVRGGKMLFERNFHHGRNLLISTHNRTFAICHVWSRSLISK